MNHAARLSRWPAALLAVAGFALALPDAAAQQISPQWLEGMHAFRRILYERQFTPVHSMQELQSDPQHGMLVVLGDTDVVDSVPGGIIQFVEQGGALLVASDRRIAHLPPLPGRIRRQPEYWEDRFGVEFVDRPVLATDKTIAYQGYEECPIVEFIRRTSIPVGENLQSPVATNCSGFLRLKPPSRILGRRLTPIAFFPTEKTQNRHAEFEGGVQETLLFAAGRGWREGRVLFLADHSVFINNMMLRKDTGNFEFTLNCLDWLSAGGKERRDRVLLYEDGYLVTDFNVPVTIPPIRLPPDLVALVDEVIADVEARDLHGEMLDEFVGHDRIVRWAVIALTVLLATYLLVRLVRSRYRALAAPLLASTLSRFAPARAGLAQRQAALLGEGNLWEPARFLARDFFETALDTPEPPAALPPFQAAIGGPARRMVERLINHLWRLAYGTKPERITPSSFAHLAAQLDELKAALADGSLRFEVIATT
jgi:hypothetical protein